MHIRATHDKRKACFTDKASELKQGRKRKNAPGSDRAAEEPRHRRRKRYTPARPKNCHFKRKQLPSASQHTQTGMKNCPLFVAGCQLFVFSELKALVEIQALLANNGQLTTNNGQLLILIAGRRRNRCASQCR
jgi:hypothetical protein